jgi:hypothetical protein
MNWFEFLSEISNTIEPYITLIIFSIWFSYIAKKENHMLSRVSILESIVGFLIVVIVISMYKVNYIDPSSYAFYTFFSAVGLLWGTQGLIWGLVFWLIPIERILKIGFKRHKSVTYS